MATGPFTIPMATRPFIIPMLTTAASGATTGPIITTIDELVASQGAVAAKQVIDTASVAPLLSSSRELLRAPLFQWAATGFSPNYIIQEFTLVPPPICADGVTRTVVEYFQLCLGVTLGNLLPTLQALVDGMTLSYSFEGNTLRIHVTKK